MGMQEVQDCMLYRQQLEQGCQQLGLKVNLTQYKQLISYLQQLWRWNKAYNFSAIRNLQDMISLHLLDSLSAAPALLDKAVNRIIDVGTGAGLPGLVLAITIPEKQFTLLDANSKKIRFLKQVKHELQLANVNLQLTRAKEFNPNRCYDRVISRAFASLPNMLDHTEHLICPKGQFIAMKGNYPEMEIRNLPSRFSLLNSQLLQVPGVTAKRHLISMGLKEAIRIE